MYLKLIPKGDCVYSHSDWLLSRSVTLSQEMDRRVFNGPEFHYKVFWRRVVGDTTWYSNVSTEPPYIVTEVGNFSTFQIKVQAANQKGEGPELDPVTGYSGEDSKMLL